MKKIAFVIPWYSDTIGGGAENACRMLAKNLHRQGVDVEILTTCVKDFRADWSKNYYPAGPAMEGGIPVRRFPVLSRNTEQFDAVNYLLMQGRDVSEEQERVFLSEMLNSPALLEFIERHQDSYSFALMPYLFSTTYWGSLAAKKSAVLIPCLHDEAYARLPAMRKMFECVRSVIFLSGAERELARNLFPSFCDAGVFGLPLETNWCGDANRFTRQYALKDFILYAGRTDPGKKADLLIDHFGRFLKETGEELDLVFIGVDRVEYPSDLEGRIHVLGFLSESEKRDCLSAALALCIPSIMESFSIVMMESWVAGRPVIANADCSVTSDFCRESNGGLWFANYEEFLEIVCYLRSNSDIATALGRNGSEFVKSRFNPVIVAANYVRALVPDSSHADMRD